MRRHVGNLILCIYVVIAGHALTRKPSPATNHPGRSRRHWYARLAEGIPRG